MKKIKKVLLTVSLIGAFACSTALLASCGGKKVGISFETNGATSMEEMKVESGKEVDLPVPTRDGYRFDGWYTTSDFSGNPVTSVTVTANVTYYAKWSQVYAVTLDLNGGTLDTTTIYLAQGDNIYNAVKDLKPTKAGLTFGAWFNGNYELSSTTTMKTGTLTLKAQYKVDYTVELWAQNLEDNEYTKVDTLTGSEYVGKKFTSTQKMTGFTDATEDVASLTKTLSANASENVFVHKFDRNTYTITFNPNIPGVGKNEVISVSAKYGAEIVVPSDPTQYSAKGYCLLGWAAGIDAKKVQYPVDLNALAYNKGDATATEVKHLVEKTTTLYGVWQKGYTDMFGSDDAIYYMESEDDAQIYLCRGNVYFKGVYDADYNEFYFNNEKNKLVLTGKLYDNGKFVYYDDSRAKANSTLYTTEDGVVETEKIRFDAYNEIRYIVYDKDGKETDTSVGSYEVAPNGDYVATFTSGNLAGQTMSFIMSTVTLENGVEQSVFQVRNPDEYQIGRIVLLGIRRDDTGTYVIGFYERMYFELDGFGTAKFTSEGKTSTYNYSTDENGRILLKDGKGNVVETICLIDSPYATNEKAKGYMVYDKTMDGVFEVDGGGTLKLDGLYSAVYQKDGKTVQSFYRHWTNPMGGTIVSIIDPATKIEQRFLLNPTTKEVGGETVDTYTAKCVLGSYAEYYYQNGSGVYYAPMLVIDETEVGKASLYGYTSKEEFIKVSEGSYTLIEEGEYKGLYLYEVDEIFHSDAVYIEPIDVTKVQWFIFALDEETSDYKVNYWYVSNYGTEEDTEHFENYTSTNKDSNESLKLVGGFAFYKANATSRAVIGTYSTSGNLLELTVDGETYYFSMDWLLKKFTTLQYKPYKSYLKHSNGTYSNSVYLDFDGIGGAVYAIDGKLIEGTIAVVESKQTVFGEVVYKFQPNSAEFADMAFEYIGFTVRSKTYYAVMEKAIVDNIYYTASTSQTQGSLTIDGYAYWAEFDDYTNTYAGVYHVADEDTIILEAGGKKFYFDFLTDGTFVVRGQAYGSYALYENQYSNGVFVELDGYGNLTAFTFEQENGTGEYKRQDISTGGSYEIENGVYTLTYGTGSEAKAYVCVLNGETYVASDGVSYTALTVSKELAKEIYVDKTDWSVLILDEFGRATKCDKEGKKQEGKFAFITDELLYFYIDGNGDACIYTYEEGEATDEYGIASPVKMKAKSYYTEELKSLYFSESGFAILNGDESNLHFYTYLEDGDGDDTNNKVAIYRRATVGESANEFGFVRDTQMFSVALGETTTYNDETYYINSGDLITFERSDAVNRYPLLGEGSVYELTSLRFAPSGNSEFEVSGQAQLKITNTDKDGNETVTNKWESCTITRHVVDGVPEMYVTVGGYYRYYITATYKADNKSYKVESLQREQALDSYYHLNEYFYTYLYNGEAVADQLKNKYGTIDVFMKYDEAGKVAQSSAKLSFGENTDFFDMDGNRLTSDNATFTMFDDGMNVAEFVAKDNYTYQVHFGVYRYPYMTSFGYYVHAVVRLQELQVDDYTITVGRVVATEQSEEEQPLGEVYSLDIKKNGIAMENAEFFHSNGKIRYVVREENDDGNVTKATYYTVTLQENDSSSVEDTVLTYASATIASENATVLFEENDKERYVEMMDGKVQFLNLHGNKRYAKDCKYNEQTGVYTVKTTDGWTYYVKVVGENVVISSNISDM